MSDPIEWPKKSRELHSHHFDSTIWNDLQFRDDDIIISTYAKSGRKRAPRCAFWDAGAEVFINKGVNGRWRDTLSDADCAAYEARAVEELGRECAHWLATGEGGP